MGKPNKKGKKKKTSNKTSHVLDTLLSPPDSTNPKTSGKGRASVKAKNVSTCTIKPPPKKPKFLEKDAPECVSVISMSKLSKNDPSHTPQKLSLWPIQIQPLFMDQIKPPTFPSIVDDHDQEKRRTNAFRTNENDDADAESQVVYSVSGTQSLGLEYSSSYTLHQEFPIPKSYQSYQTGKTSESNAGLQTGTVDADANETQKNNNDHRRDFKSPNYRLIVKPKSSSTRKPEIYLSEGAYNSELVLQLSVADEALRGHPPCKKTKLDAEFTSVAASYAAEKLTGTQKRDNRTSKNKVNSQHSLNYLLESKRRAISDFLDEEQSSETEEELRNLDNADDGGINNMFDFSGINGEKSSENQIIEQRHELQGKEAGNPTVDKGSSSSSKILQGIYKLASFFSFGKLKNSSFQEGIPEDKQSYLTKLTTGDNIGNLGPEEPRNEVTQVKVTSTEGVVPTKRRPSTPKTQRSLTSSSPKATLCPNTAIIPEEDDRNRTNKAGIKNKKGHRRSNSKRTLPESEKDARFELDDLLNNKMLETPREKPKAHHSKHNHSSKSKPTKTNGTEGTLHGIVDGISKHPQHQPDRHRRNRKPESKDDPLTLADAALEYPSDPEPLDELRKVAYAPVTSPRSILKPGINSLTSTATKNVTMPERRSFFQTILNFFRSNPKKDKKLSFQTESVENIKPSQKKLMERKSFFEKLGFKTRKVSDAINDNTAETTTATVPNVNFEKVQNPLVKKHMDSVVVLRQKRMKLFLETREFYEDSIMAYSSVLQGSQCTVPSSLQMVQPLGLTLDSSRPLTLLPSVLLSQRQSMGIGSFKCTLSESVIEPSISRRKRRLNENIKLFDPHSENDNNTEDIVSKKPNLL